MGVFLIVFNWYFVKLCKINEIPFPNFWFDESQQQYLYTKPEEEIVKGSLTQGHIDRLWLQLNHKQKARLLSRETAKVIWKDNPQMPIAAMEREPDFLKYGQCTVYAGKNTKRDWIKDLNPNAGRGGRPKKLN